MGQDQRLELQEDAQSAFQDTIQPGRVSALLCYFTGTNAGSTTGDFDTLGEFIIKRNGKTIMNRPAAVFADMLNIRRGSNLLSSTGSGAFEATVIIPFYEKSFPQALQIANESELKVEYSPGANQSSVFSDLQVTVYSQLSMLNEKYRYQILGNDVTPGAAVNSRPYQLHEENVSAVYITDPNSVVDDVGFRQDGTNTYSEQPFNVLLAKTLADNRLETTSFDMIQLKAFTAGENMSVISNTNVLQLTTSGGNTVPITVCSMHNIEA